VPCVQSIIGLRNEIPAALKGVPCVKARFSVRACLPGQQGIGQRAFLRLADNSPYADIGMIPLGIKVKIAVNGACGELAVNLMRVALIGVK
jgi:hypothetical protein